MPGIDAARSDIRMAVLYKRGHEKNITWYSFLRYNGRKPEFIIKKMISNFRKWPKANMDDVQVFQFYNNLNEELIVEYKEGDTLP